MLPEPAGHGERMCSTEYPFDRHVSLLDVSQGLEALSGPAKTRSDDDGVRGVAIRFPFSGFPTVEAGVRFGGQPAVPFRREPSPPGNHRREREKERQRKRARWRPADLRITPRVHGVHLAISSQRVQIHGRGLLTIGPETNVFEAYSDSHEGHLRLGGCGMRLVPKGVRRGPGICVFFLTSKTCSCNHGLTRATCWL